ncbi:MAG: exopolysaccharide biosynthesis protein [Thermoleophilaceae bacterium]
METGATSRPDANEPLSDQLEHWLQSDGDKTLGTLIEFFEKKSFAILFVLLLSVPALPLPTGGVTHVFEVIAILLALQLIAGRETIWLPQRWRMRRIAEGSGRAVQTLLKLIRMLERFSRPRLAWLFDHRLSNVIFGAVVAAGAAAAFLAPPFSGLDTLPALGVVLVSLGVLMEDFAVVLAGLAVGAGGIVLELFVGRAVFDAIKKLL